VAQGHSGTDPRPSAPPHGGTLAITNAKIYASPDAAAIERGTVLVREGRIEAVGPGIAVPPGALEVSANHGAVTAGFWNAHVHLTEGKWAAPHRTPASVLDHHLAEMFTSRGFTTVVDVGSDPRVTIPLRRRVAAGELVGPAILTSGPPLYPPKGIPFYVKDAVPWYVRWFMPQPATPAAAVKAVERNVRWGADLLKLFTGSYVAKGRVLPMPEPVARAAVEAAHAHGQLVYAHPSNLEGTRVAAQSGVDVLAHAPDDTEGVDDALLRNLVDRRMVMIPTLKMFGTTVTSSASYLEPIYALVRRFRELGGRLLFGTDVGYMTDYSTEGEFAALGRSGLDATEILRALTVGPSERFGVAKDHGTVAVGKRADLVVLDGDPFEDPGAFARVRLTVRAGRVVWSRA